MMQLKYRNLIRNTLSITWFNALPVAAGYAGWALAQGGNHAAWGGVLLTTVPMLLWVTYAMVTKNLPRSSHRLPLINAQGALGVAAAAYGLLVQDAGTLPLLIAVGIYIGFLWYSYSYAGFLGARPSRALTVGRVMPAFSVSDVTGKPIHSDKLFQRPTIVVFYRGNWCPFCVAQVKELSQRYQEIEAMGVGLVLISPQPHGNSQALAQRFNIRAEFLVDEGNAAARALGIESEYGIPTGFQALGYDSDTVMPTVVIVETGGRIVWVDETNNYRVRPEPDAFLEVLRREGLGVHDNTARLRVA